MNNSTHYYKEGEAGFLEIAGERFRGAGLGGKAADADDAE